jgi:uncharacterized protein (DUF1330 family)
MKKGYWTVAYRKIPDFASVKAYAAAANPIIASYGGKVLGFAGDDIVVHEQGVPLLSVIVEFDNVQKAREAYNDPAYLATLEMFTPGTERDFRIFEGAV